MRLFRTAWLPLWLMAAAVAQAAGPADTPNPPAAIAAPASPTAAAAAAARHAKRTACRKQAAAMKVKKAELTAFIHQCLAKP